MDNERTPQTLFINDWYSECGACGNGADPDESAHITRLGWDNGDGKGCGAEWRYVSTTSLHCIARVQEMRPDLEYWGVS